MITYMSEFQVRDGEFKVTDIFLASLVIFIIHRFVWSDLEFQKAFYANRLNERTDTHLNKSSLFKKRI